MSPESFSAVTRQAGASDPTGVVDFGELMVIDEIQRVPELLLAIKEQVDTDPRPGRYLLIGSARILGLRSLPDTFPGHTETVELWPFSQGEIDGRTEGFVDAAFTDGEALNHTSTVRRGEYAQRIVRGGFPEAVARAGRRVHGMDEQLARAIGERVKLPTVAVLTKLAEVLGDSPRLTSFLPWFAWLQRG